MVCGVLTRELVSKEREHFEAVKFASADLVRGLSFTYDLSKKTIDRTEFQWKYSTGERRNGALLATTEDRIACLVAENRYLALVDWQRDIVRLGRYSRAGAGLDFDGRDASATHVSRVSGREHTRVCRLPGCLGSGGDH